MPHREGRGLNANELHVSVLKEGWQSRLSYVFLKQKEWTDWGPLRGDIRTGDSRNVSHKGKRASHGKLKHFSRTCEDFSNFLLSTQGTKQIALKTNVCRHLALTPALPLFKKFYRCKSEFSSFADNRFFSLKSFRLQSSEERDDPKLVFSLTM